jgi:hypothetical protein
MRAFVQLRFTTSINPLVAEGNLATKMQWNGSGPCDHLHLHETLTVVLDRLNVIIDRLNVISSGRVVCTSAFAPCSPDAKVCFQGDNLAAIFEV